MDSCANDIAAKVSLINNINLETFTLEPNEGIYYIGYDSCFNDPEATFRTNRSILGTTLNAREKRVYTGSASPVVTTDSFDRILFFAAEFGIVAVDTSQVATCPVFSPLVDFDITPSPVSVLRTYRSVKQPQPSKSK